MWILAHGALGWYDELVFLGVAVIFLAMMGVSWFRTRMTEYDDDRRPDNPLPQTFEEQEQSAERFTLD